VSGKSDNSGSCCPNHETQYILTWSPWSKPWRAVTYINCPLFSPRGVYMSTSYISFSWYFVDKNSQYLFFVKKENPNIVNYVLFILFKYIYRSSFLWMKIFQYYTPAKKIFLTIPVLYSTYIMRYTDVKALFMHLCNIHS
jgi:hypothetical protein